MNILHYLTVILIIQIVIAKKKRGLFKNKRQSLSSAVSSLFYYDTNVYRQLDGADAESYSTSLFNYLMKHLFDVKRQQTQCKNIPLPKTVLNQKYFNPNYELQQAKNWYPPRDHLYVITWAQKESYRNSLFLSYMLQDDNAKFPPGWLYLYLTTAAQLHTLQMIGYNSHKSIKAIKLPFDSNEVFKVDWYTSGNYQKFEKPFALYATKPKNEDPRFVRIIDFGVGNYTNDYTGHAFIGSFLYDQQQYLLNTSYEISNNWLRPIQPINQQINRPIVQTQTLSPQQQQMILQAQQQQLQQQQLQQQLQQQQYQYQQQQQQLYYQQNPQQQQQQQQQQSSYNQQQQQQQEQQQPSYYQQNDYPYKDQYKMNFDFLVQNNIPVYNWDPLVDNEKTNYNYRLQDNEMKYGFDEWYKNTLARNNELYKQNNPNLLNPFALPNVKYIESYKFAKVWWNNESAFTSNKQDYLFRIKPEERYYKFVAAKSEGGVLASAPYFWCTDPTTWLATLMTPIWATNDFDYKNKIFLTYDRERFAGLSEVVLNYEEVDINQCPGDRQMNAFSSTALCDSTTQCLPLAGYGLNTGGYECFCMSGYRYPQNFEGPFRGKELSDQYRRNYPLCVKSEGLLQYPNWISKSNIYYPGFETNNRYGTDFNYYRNYATNDLFDYPINSQKDSLIVNLDDTIEKVDLNSNNDDSTFKKYDHLIFPYKTSKKRSSDQNRQKRFLDRRNSFEKLRDAIYSSDILFRRQCFSRIQDVLRLFEDDERFIINLRYYVNDVFRAQMAQAIRIAHILSSYIQLHVPFGTTSFAGNQYDSFNSFANTVGIKMKQDPQLDERLVIAEIMSTLNAHYPLLEVNVFFNGSEYARQKLYATQNTLAFGLSMIRTDSEMWLNRSNDDSHLTKSWYQDAINRFTYAGKGTFSGAGAFQPNNERNFYLNPDSFDLNSMSYRIDRYTVEMNLRRTFDGLTGSVNLPIKYYDAASSGVWFGPYYDCQKRTTKPSSTIRMSYSVPIVTGSNKPPVGFASVVIGSDLKWWKINPCDASKGRNIFQSLHKCDLETTVCEYQDVPEFEDGYYLASYKCVCRVNYEFPFIDTGTSYFEGATIEREFEKKMKGQSNIYDRMKCRPVLKNNRRDNSDERLYVSYAFKLHNINILKLFSIIFIIIILLDHHK